MFWICCGAGNPARSRLSGGFFLGRERPFAGQRPAESRQQPGLCSRFWRAQMNMKTKTKRAVKRVRRVAKRRPTVGARIIEGLEQAIAWTRGENENVHVTLVHVPNVDVREVRTKMGLSQAQFATKFGFPPATLRNWEQGRSRPDAPLACYWP